MARDTKCGYGHEEEDPPVKQSMNYVCEALILLAAVVMVCPVRGAEPAVTRSTVEYTVPQITLIRADGKSVSLPGELDDGRPVVMNFVFTSCTTICPLLSQTFERLQAKLGADRDKVHIVSISIDPEQDTPARLLEYARRYSAGPEWDHYTGTTQAVLKAERAFNAYRGDKMNHTPLTLLRLEPGKPWIRFDGFVSAGELAREIRSGVIASK
jgi:protein SCO1/2